MASVIIVSGCPGTGKTSVAARLAEQSPRGVHIVADLFYDFVSHRVLQILPESHAQNTIVVTAVARAAGAFASGGYDVVLDGVFGPWFVPLLARELEPAGVPVDYVVLRAPLEIALGRATLREEPGEDGIVRHMHAQFAELCGLEGHAVETGTQSVDETVAEIDRRLTSREFRLDLARLS
ncbi:MAG: ATP-binding protein [Actinobacteria bacterium]|nr:ATP-binding protein [Actinomycetota bacterium]